MVWTDTWDDSRIQRLRTLWADGLSAQKIADAMGTSKNAIVGKVHRLVLPPRPSPIRRTEPGAAKRRNLPKHVRGAETLAVLGVVTSEPEAVRTAAATRVAPSVPVSDRGIPIFATPAIPAMPAIRQLNPRAPAPRRTCCWPIGEPRTPGFRWCQAVAREDRPYCPEHCAIAYVPASVRRDGVRA